MKTKYFFILIITSTIMSSCGVPKSDYAKLLIEKEKLANELDECKNGAERLIATIDKEYEQKDYQTAKQNIELLFSKHPESPKNLEYKELLKNIDQIESEIAKKRQTEEKERTRLTNLNNTGIWRIGRYVDEFGEPTKQGYITNTDYIKGTFSNTATQNSELNVNFLINNSSNISMQLYEYAGENPVKAYSSELYHVNIQDKDGNRVLLIATNRSDRLSLDQSGSRQVHRILLKGGLIKFRIEEFETSSSQYQFYIQNADFYDNAYRLLTETKSK
jgi:hypothetical protein